MKITAARVRATLRRDADFRAPKFRGSCLRESRGQRVEQAVGGLATGFQPPALGFQPPVFGFSLPGRTSRASSDDFGFYRRLCEPWRPCLPLAVSATRASACRSGVATFSRCNAPIFSWSHWGSTTTQPCTSIPYSRAHTITTVKTRT